ncbi:MAG: biosynthetic peptidoglycan transglycosylase, partial [Acutalibacteraceae bacterium]|nr:biosynthetic peptidoglycan transglycosylase [Acutalibacteraceae bacterium]
MEKIFKKFCLVLSFLLVVSSVSLCFTSPRSINLNKFDFDMFECKSVVNSVKNLDLKQTSIIYVKNKSGNWVEYQRLHGDENRILVDKDKFSKNLKNAFIAIEDERFLEHDGVDWKRTFFAMGNLVFKYYSSNQGGSTITQQLIKNITDDRDNSGMRKIREIVRALYLETKMEKDDILAAYLNTIALA